VRCLFGHVAQSDVNAALNILLRGSSALGLTVKVPDRLRAHSFIPTPGGVLEPKKKDHNPAL